MQLADAVASHRIALHRMKPTTARSLRGSHITTPWKKTPTTTVFCHSKAGYVPLSSSRIVPPPLTTRLDGPWKAVLEQLVHKRICFRFPKCSDRTGLPVDPEYTYGVLFNASCLFPALTVQLATDSESIAVLTSKLQQANRERHRGN